MDTFIQFIGLFVFMTLTPDGNATGRMALGATSSNISHSIVVAIAPRVSGDPRFQRPAPTTARNRMITQTTKAAVEHTNSHGAIIEDHSTIMCFHHADLDPFFPVKGWTPVPLKPNDPLNPNDWYYVELSGEQITFVTDMANPDIDTKSLKALPIRHLGHTLKPEYTASGNYAGDAGVFTITQGTLSVCSPHKESPDGLPSRTDTKLTLQIDQDLIIRGSGNKSITLMPGASLFVATIPMLFAKTGILTPNAPHHYKEYCQMVGDTVCQWPPAALAAEQRGYQVSDCGDGIAFRQRAGHTERTLPPFVVPGNEMSDYACSNTQWP